MHARTVHLHAGARVLRERLVHVHHRRRLRRRRRRHRHGDGRPVADRGEPDAGHTDDRPRRDLDQPRRHPVRADARTRRRRLQRAVRQAPPFVGRSPFAKRSPFAQALAAVRVRPVRSSGHRGEQHAAVGDPGRLSRAVGRHCSSEHRSPGEPTQSITFEQFLALYDPRSADAGASRPDPRRHLVLRWHAARRREPGGVLARCAPRSRASTSGPRRGAHRLAADTAGESTCASLGCRPDDDTDGARRRCERREGPRRSIPICDECRCGQHRRVHRARRCSMRG